MAFEVVQLPCDVQGARAWLEKYKALRLYALKTEPKAFGSTHEREVAFNEDEWLKRLTDTDAITIVAVQDGELIGTLTTMHLLCEPDEIVIPGTVPEASKVVHEGPPPLHYRVFGMFTKHGCRGQGVGKALLKAAVKYGQDLAGRLERPYVGTLVSESDNDAARALYGKVGFVPIKTVQYVLHYERTLVVFQYKPEVEVKEAR